MLRVPTAAKSEMRELADPGIIISIEGIVLRGTIDAVSRLASRCNWIIIVRLLSHHHPERRKATPNDGQTSKDISPS